MRYLYCEYVDVFWKIAKDVKKQTNLISIYCFSTLFEVH